MSVEVTTFVINVILYVVKTCTTNMIEKDNLFNK